MAEDTKIEWCNHTFNPWRGCVKISAGCANCYAADLSKRNPGVLGEWGKDAARVEAVESYWLQPLRWHEAAVKAGEIRTVFVGSLMDVGEDRADLDPQRDRLMALIALTPLVKGEDGKLSGLRYLLLTKRPGALQRYLDAPGLYELVMDAADWYRSRRPALGNVPIGDLWHSTRAAWYPHLWIGTSVEDQAAADERIPELLSIDCAGRFLSMEPLLGPVDLGHLWRHAWSWPVADGTLEQAKARGSAVLRPFGLQARGARLISWVIVGGESGPRARPMHPEWARSVRDKCQAAHVPFLFKQWGCWLPQGQKGQAVWYGHLLTRDGRLLTLTEALLAGEPNGTLMAKMDKHAAGRLLDGQLHDDKPASWQ